MSTTRVAGVTILEDGNHQSVIVTDRASPYFDCKLKVLSARENLSLPPGIKVDFLVAEQADDTLGALDLALLPPNAASAATSMTGSSIFSEVANRVEREVRLLLEAGKMPRGNGGAKHRVIQLMVKELGEQLGFTAHIEQRLPNGQSIDVALIRYDLRIACEVPVSTKHKESGNLSKCLEFGYDHVISVSLESATLKAVRSRAEEELTPEQLRQVQFFLPEELGAFLESLPRKERPSEEKVIRGWKVKSRWVHTTPEDAAQRRATIVRILATARVH